LTCYVDELRRYRHGPTHFDSWCHLYCDGGPEELHAFADRLGLKRAWYQDRPGFPHHDLPPPARERAIALGAIAITARELVRLVRRHGG
jgi:hypothetical protein